MVADAASRSQSCAVCTCLLLGDEGWSARAWVIVGGGVGSAVQIDDASQYALGIVDGVGICDEGEEMQGRCSTWESL